jgi:hypothetical protein
MFPKLRDIHKIVLGNGSKLEVFCVEIRVECLKTTPGNVSRISTCTLDSRCVVGSLKKVFILSLDKFDLNLKLILTGKI